MPSDANQELPGLDELAALVAEASKVAVLCGAGISAASGIPTFRGAEGLWRKHRAEELATPEAFAADPQLVWDWYGWRRRLILEARPNPAHFALCDLCDLCGEVEELTIITQNVDGLHQLAATERGTDPPPELLEVHGSIWVLRCPQCGREVRDRSGEPAEGSMPRCRCGAVQRPGVVWFGEQLDEDTMRRAGAAASRCDVFLVVGTSAVVYPAASLASVAAWRGTPVAEFNLEATALKADVRYAFAGPAEVTLPLLVDEVRRRKGAR